VALSLDDLRAFVAAADGGSVGRAAQSLGVTPSALSKRIKHLEALSGVSLLVRSSTGVEPSAAGRALLADARRALAQADAVEDRLTTLSRELEPVRMAASPGIAERVIPSAMGLLEVGAASLPVELLVANSMVVRQMVLDGRADLGVAAANVDDELGHLGRPLADDELVVVMPPEHPWTAHGAVPAAALATERLILRDPGSHIRRTLDAGVRAAGVTLATPLMEAGNAAAVKAAVRARGVPGVLSQFAVDERFDGLVTRPIDGVLLRRRYWVLVAPGASPEVRRVADGLSVDVKSAPR
jgi:DNA-binding transcriptional LysR family regulator